MAKSGAKSDRGNTPKKKTARKAAKRVKRTVKGRPRKDFDLKSVEKLGSLGATYEEVASFFDTTARTIERRMEEGDEDIVRGSFCRAYKKGLSNLKMSLRRQQIELAMQGNVGMCIWLGKIFLDQTDTSKIKNEIDVRSITPVINLQANDPNKDE